MVYPCDDLARFSRLAALTVVFWSTVPPAGAQAPPPVGVSEMRGQWFENEDVLDFQASPGDEFAGSIAAGDFDGDGYADLAVGIPGCESDEFANAGCEVVVYGSLFSDGFETANLGRWSDSSQL